jgi:hypothetical protein
MTQEIDELMGLRVNNEKFRIRNSRTPFAGARRTNLKKLGGT